jgi:hypothetical protein
MSWNFGCFVSNCTGLYCFPSSVLQNQSSIQQKRSRDSCSRAEIDDFSVEFKHSTLKILHFGLMTTGTIRVRGMGELLVRHISDWAGLGNFSGTRSVNPGPFPGFLRLVWFPELPTLPIQSRLRADSFGWLLLWDSERIDWWQGPGWCRVPHSPDLDELATLPKSTSFRPKPEWTSDSYNFLPNVEEETNACWFVVWRAEAPGSAVKGP